MNTGNRIKELRKTHELTQEELAALVGVSRQTIISLEKGKFDPSLSLAFEIARVFKTTVDEMFGSH